MRGVDLGVGTAPAQTCPALDAQYFKPKRETVCFLLCETRHQRYPLPLPCCVRLKQNLLDSRIVGNSILRVHIRSSDTPRPFPQLPCQNINNKEKDVKVLRTIVSTLNLGVIEL